MKLRVKEICKSKGLLMEELASKLGIARVNFTKTINGNPTVESLKKIADVLNVSIVELFEPQSYFTALISNKGELKQFNSVDELKKYAETLDL